MRSRPHLRHPVSVNLKGTNHLGCYYLDDDSVTVHYGKKGSKPIRLEGLAPEACARKALLDLVRKG